MQKHRYKGTFALPAFLQAHETKCEKPPKPPWRPRRLDGPNQLLESFVEYAKHVEKNPFLEETVLYTSNGTVVVKLKRERPMTIANFCLFLDVNSQAWRYWRRNREDLVDAIERIENAVFAHKFERVAAGIFKANLISRELGSMRNS